MRVEMFSGSVSCRECRQSWFTTWNARAPKLICHDCGGSIMPEGPQIPTVSVPSAIDGEMYRLEMRARWRAMS